LDFENFDSEELKLVLRDTMHEVREFNRIIKANSEMLTRLLRIDQERTPLNLDQQNADNARGQALAILQTAQMLSARLDLIDFETNPSAFESEPRVSTSVFGKFDKARKMLGPKAREKSVKIQLEGTSMRKLDMYPVFDIVPFLLVENAVKYAPRNSDITIHVSEHPREIEVTVESLGPMVPADEISKLFEKGYRGKEATKLNEKGSGFGLHFARFASQINDVTISLTSGSEVCSFNGVKYSQFRAQVRVPTAVSR
jgi:signal transduction histidine kinase